LINAFSIYLCLYLLALNTARYVWYTKPSPEKKETHVTSQKQGNDPASSNRPPERLHSPTMAPKPPSTSSPGFLHLDFGDDITGHHHEADKAAGHIDAHLCCVAARFCGCVEDVVIAWVAMFGCACEDEVAILGFVDVS
jgi:hypothetical protein